MNITIAIIIIIIINIIIVTKIILSMIDDIRVSRMPC